MAVPVIEKQKLPAVAPENKDGDVIVQSEAQCDPYKADPHDFEILDPIDGVLRETPAHGQHGRTSAEHRRLLAKGAADKGKSQYRKEK